MAMEPTIQKLTFQQLGKLAQDLEKYGYQTLLNLTCFGLPNNGKGISSARDLVMQFVQIAMSLKDLNGYLVDAHLNALANEFVKPHLQGGGPSADAIPPAPADPAVTEKAIVFICTKTAECDAMAAVVRQEVLCGHLAADTNGIPNKEVIVSGKMKQAQYWRHVWHVTSPKRYRLVLVTFAGVQGPVAAAARTACVLRNEQPCAIGMVGICGGDSYGDVIVAIEAAAPTAGRVVKEGAGSAEDKALDHLKHGVASLPDAVDEGYVIRHDGDVLTEACTLSPLFAENARAHMESFFLGTEGLGLGRLPRNPTDADRTPGKCVWTAGRLYSYEQVREDCAWELERLRKAYPDAVERVSRFGAGIDMEAYAFFYTLRMCGEGVVSFPVIKCVSDVGAEVRASKHNKQFEKDHKVPDKCTHEARRKICTAHAATQAARVAMVLLETSLPQDLLQ